MSLHRTNPGDDDFSHVIIRYSTSDYPLSREDGTAVEKGNGGIFPGTHLAQTSEQETLVQSPLAMAV